jgi:hypothetical protein
MSITVNDNGTLRKLATVSANDGGALRVLKSISANDGGVLRSIYAKAAFPDAQSGSFTYRTTSGTSQNPQTFGNAFNITGETTITVNLSNIKYGNGNSKQCQFRVYDNSSGNSLTDMELSKGLPGENYGSATATVSKAGNYVIKALLFSVTGSQSGVSFYDGSCDYTITFS